MDEIILIKKVKENDDCALRELIKQYEKMIYKIIQLYTLSQGDYRISKDELFQEGCIGIYDACKSYSKRSNCKFSTFAYLVIKRRISKAVYHNLRIYYSECFSIDVHDNLQNSLFYETKYVEDNPIDYEDEKQKNVKIDNALSSLNNFDRKMIRLRLMNYSYKEIARMLKVSRKKVDNRIQYLKKRKFGK